MSTIYNPNPLFISNDNLGAATDLYQLTMAAGYLKSGINDISTFEMWIRTIPVNRSFLIAAGLEQVLYYIKNLSFSRKTIDYLRRHKIFEGVDDSFFQYLREFKFSGDIYAVPEGSVIFQEEPILRVTAPLIESQIVETYLLATINFQTMVASKAARIVLSAKGRDIIDFGSRRAHGIQAGVLAARASYIGGCAGTSNVLTGQELGIPTMGTVAHSWTMAFGNELESFKKFHESFPENTILLIDTYDNIRGANLAVEIGDKLKGVRIDSGNILEISNDVRKILDKAGLKKTKIVASGDLNEYKIDRLVNGNAPIDIFGVGTEMVVSKDHPYLGCIYKLVEQEKDGQTIAKIKLSKDKATYPFKKQIFRIADKNGMFIEDIVGLEEETFELEIAEGRAPNGSISKKCTSKHERNIRKATRLLVAVVKNGGICYDLPDINEIQQNAMKNVSSLPEVYKRINCRNVYPVSMSQKLEEEKCRVEKQYKQSSWNTTLNKK